MTDGIDSSTTTTSYERPRVAWEETIDVGPALALACPKFPGSDPCKLAGGFRHS